MRWVASRRLICLLSSLPFDIDAVWLVVHANVGNIRCLRKILVRTKRVSSAVYGAMQGKRRNWLKRLYLSRRKKEEQIPLIVCKLPMEVLYIILDYRPSRTVARAERALGVRVSTTFWYFRIVNNFFEVRGLPVNKDAYKRLCLKLEEQIYGNEALRIRRYLFNCMDNILDTVNMLQQGNLIHREAS
ncbi:hypothetical protein CBS115989_3046 [Aspergillus niger]|nr:hypothetical protein CBS115989_3046 [Aspergillus niger]KAI2857224.1 hypothetical protein CBS11232_3300 [Aspergillus niger]KAI2875721.1 hypothetical protein CBS115988_5160 [Aspergillus niger]KAI2886727.1 hypothetical protein CBS11852_7789 [Aspergillus niger]KAI2958815.1 hypothetical protein CBS147323_8591 [Aspergillus niger]